MHGTEPELTQQLDNNDNTDCHDTEPELTQNLDNNDNTDCHDTEPELTQHLDNNDISGYPDPKPGWTTNLDTNVNSDRSPQEANQKIPRFKICRQISQNTFVQEAEIAVPHSRPPSQGMFSAQRINAEGEIATHSRPPSQGMFSAHRINDEGEIAPHAGARICLRERRFSGNLRSLQEMSESRNANLAYVPNGSMHSYHGTSSEIPESGTSILMWIFLGFVGFWFLAWLCVTLTGYSFIVSPMYCFTWPLQSLPSETGADLDDIDDHGPVVKEREMRIFEREIPDEHDPGGKKVIQRHEVIKERVGGYERNGGYDNGRGNGRGEGYSRQSRNYEPERARGRN